MVILFQDLGGGTQGFIVLTRVPALGGQDGFDWILGEQDICTRSLKKDK